MRTYADHAKGGDAPGTVVLERADGRSGELVLRRHGADLEVIAGGTFLISSANAASSEALVTAGLRHLAPAAAPSGGLEVLIGGLGLGYALDAALAEQRVERVTVAEYEPIVVDWFRAYGAGRAARLTAGEAAGRARVVVADVADVMRESPGSFDLVALDTDNGPDWLVRAANAGLYDDAGLQSTRRSLRLGGVAAFWSPERYAWFAARLTAVFEQLREEQAHDHVGGRRHEYTMYVARRGVD